MKWLRKNKPEFIHPQEQLRAEKLAHIGIELRLKRQEKGLSLEQVAAKTRIRRRLLQAIEEGKLDELPEPIYIQGLIKQYAQALGLNGTELANTFPTGDRRLSIKPVWTNLPAAQLQSIHLYLLYILVISFAVNTLSHLLSRSEIRANSNLIQEEPIAPASQPDQLPPTQLEKVKPVSATPSNSNDSNKQVRIDVTLKAESWLRVVADGKTQFEGLLPQGTQRTWVAQSQLKIIAGNAGGVLVTFNQEEAKQLGNPGEVQEVTFAANQQS
jgi:cytoskeletal protein RodZ